jgi:hypothetical protein
MFNESALGRINMDQIIKNIPMDVIARAQQDPNFYKAIKEISDSPTSATMQASRGGTIAESLRLGPCSVAVACCGGWGWLRKVTVCTELAVLRACCHHQPDPDGSRLMRCHTSSARAPSQPIARQ